MKNEISFFFTIMICDFSKLRSLYRGSDFEQFYRKDYVLEFCEMMQRKPHPLFFTQFQPFLLGYANTVESGNRFVEILESITNNVTIPFFREMSMIEALTEQLPFTFCGLGTNAGTLIGLNSHLNVFHKTDLLCDALATNSNVLVDKNPVTGQVTTVEYKDDFIIHGLANLAKRFFGMIRYPEAEFLALDAARSDENANKLYPYLNLPKDMPQNCWAGQKKDIAKEILCMASFVFARGIIYMAHLKRINSPDQNVMEVLLSSFGYRYATFIACSFGFKINGMTTKHEFSVVDTQSIITNLLADPLFYTHHNSEIAYLLQVDFAACFVNGTSTLVKLFKNPVICRYDPAYTDRYYESNWLQQCNQKYLSQVDYERTHPVNEMHHIEQTERRTRAPHQQPNLRNVRVNEIPHVEPAANDQQQPQQQPNNAGNRRRPAFQTRQNGNRRQPANRVNDGAQTQRAHKSPRSE